MSLLPIEIRDQLPGLNGTRVLGLAAPALVKFVDPETGWQWYGVEFDGRDTFFGAIVGLAFELGFFCLSELEGNRGTLRPPIERDLSYKPMTLQELRVCYEREDYVL